MHKNGCNQAIILAAGMSSRFYGHENLSKHKSTEPILLGDSKDNKGLSKINNSLLINIIDTLLSQKNINIFVVSNYIPHNKLLNIKRIKFCMDSKLTRKSSSGSSCVGMNQLKKGKCSLLIDGDLFFSKKDFEAIYPYLNGNSLLMTPHTGSGDECVAEFNAGRFSSFTKKSEIVEKTQNPEYIGLSHFNYDFIKSFMHEAKDTEYLEPYENLIPKIAQKGHPISFLYTNRFMWKDLDTKEDISVIRKLHNESNF